MARLPEPDQSTDTACYVAEFAKTRVARDAASWGRDLRPEVLDALREAARWRHFTPHAADVVTEIGRRHGLPGIVIVFRVKRGGGPRRADEHPQFQRRGREWRPDRHRPALLRLHRRRGQQLRQGVDVGYPHLLRALNPPAANRSEHAPARR
jgi:hypothetical protein